MPSTVMYFDLTSGSWQSFSGSPIIPNPGDNFTYGSTKPKRPVDPNNPTGDFNVGWDGTVGSGKTFNTSQSPATGTTAVDCVFNHYCIPGADVDFQNCRFNGGPLSGAHKGYAEVGNAASFTRCTFWGRQSTLSYYVNGIHHTAGTLTVDRCVFGHFNDDIHSSGGSTKVISTGNYYGEHAAWDNDLDHPPPATPNYWSHNDTMQKIGGIGSGNEDLFFGDFHDCYFATNGVTWTGGTWGSGTVTPGSASFGSPYAMLNGGYWRLPYTDEADYGYAARGTWSNGLTWSNTPGGFYATIEKCWFDGVNASSGLVQMVTPTTVNHITLKGNRFGLGGHRSGAGILYLISYPPTDTTATIGTGVDANIYDTRQSVPITIQGNPLTFTSGGAKIDMDLV